MVFLVSDIFGNRQVTTEEKKKRSSNSPISPEEVGKFPFSWGIRTNTRDQVLCLQNYDPAAQDFDAAGHGDGQRSGQDPAVFVTPEKRGMAGGGKLKKIFKTYPGIPQFNIYVNYP